MRARYPDKQGYLERNGVRVYYELHGEGDRTTLFLPPWSIVHSHCWKMQVPFFARHGRVLTFDGRGNGLSDRPTEPAAYIAEEFAADALAILDATETERADLVGFSLGSLWGLLLAANHPDRVSRLALICPHSPLVPPHPERQQYSFDEPLDTDEGWAKFNRHYWQHHFGEFVDFFFSKMFTEPHSTKQREDGGVWGRQTTPEALMAALSAIKGFDRARAVDLCRRVRCPVLVMHGDQDAIRPYSGGEALAEELGGTFVSLEGSGHAPHLRDPVKVNVLLHDFIAGGGAPTRWSRSMRRRRRALFISSPIGLGHAQRDVAVARELRALVPDLEIDWLAMHPVTQVLEGEGERIHPASTHLANESTHIESESAEHDLHCFQAWRRMDEILLANFMVFHDLVREEHYDLWLGDEAWELDYYLHENPELKRAAYVWMTDFVGWLPMPDGGDREACLTADYNAEMIEHIARYPRIRDRALYVGNADDIVPDRFGSGLPAIREWTEAHYAFPGYISGFTSGSLSDRPALRHSLGYAPDERVCIVTVGGSGVGGHLLRRVIAAFPEAKRRVPELRMIVVAGPRIDPASLPKMEGLEVRPYVHNLYRHLAACDLAVVQGGLTTSMELTANRRPFLYFPLRHHFEQNFHVHHRLQRYGAGRCMEFATSTPDVIASAIAEEIGRDVTYRDVETDGARRAAQLIAELL